MAGHCVQQRGEKHWAVGAQPQRTHLCTTAQRNMIVNGGTSHDLYGWTALSLSAEEKKGCLTSTFDQEALDRCSLKKKKLKLYPCYEVKS